MDLRIEALTPENLEAVLALPPQSGDDEPVAPTAWSVAEAYVQPTAWPRAITADGAVVGFVMANWSPDESEPAFRAGIWRMNVAADARRRGIGRFAVEQVAAEARRRGVDRITVLWDADHPRSPEGFYLRCGFRPVGELFGQRLGELRV
ncbi:GNAT family N-acetyltransferase [Isoptericola halotolerans]|uniref:Diamine N-acetyltransferase n=1 Tax=Isoptericola halotolerans TaxID=300560 RepID=A0ABX2A8N4_9MICO|nr:GNAT family N-acetyltransferase [Isoptericola halotolerans]NOV99075.1 diamine N-acetyltransferase [Isoptericola halotolerans]